MVDRSNEIVSHNSRICGGTSQFIELMRLYLTIQMKTEIHRVYVYEVTHGNSWVFRNNPQLMVHQSLYVTVHWFSMISVNKEILTQLTCIVKGLLMIVQLHRA